MRAQQRAFDRFRDEYNEVRPHEALGMETPASRYAASAHPYPSRILASESPGHFTVKGVTTGGTSTPAPFGLRRWTNGITSSGSDSTSAPVDTLPSTACARCCCEVCGGYFWRPAWPGAAAPLSAAHRARKSSFREG
ncbi:MAG: integrase core domain-containing protein [Gemmatimonadaceae bacterium]|nr:integrase core domain-containing protein [Gemmatimonadaceae bacterium]